MGRPSTWQVVEDQLIRYSNSAWANGSLRWWSGWELVESAWAVSYDGPREPGSLWDRVRWVAWSSYPGHIYFAPLWHAPEHVQVRARFVAEEPYWSQVPFRVRTPVVV
jgi:hypothetical protein